MPYTSIQALVRKNQLLAFFVIAYAIMFGVLFTFIYSRPGEPLQPWSFVWFFSIFSPSFSALIVSWIAGGMPEVKRLLSGFTRWKTGIFWYFAAAFLFLCPLAIALIYIALGNSFTGIKEGETFSSLTGVIVFALFSGPVAEEMGWRGFALPRLQARYNALVSSLLLGVIWCCWHLPLFYVTGATQMSIPFPIYLVLVVTVAVYLTWLYNNTQGSYIITILGHFAYNLSGGFIAGTLGLIPPMLLYMTAGPLLGVAVIAVVILYGPQHLSRPQKAAKPRVPNYSSNTSQ